MTQNKTDKTNTTADNRDAATPQFIMDNRELFHLAVRGLPNMESIVFVLMCPRKDMLRTFIEQRSFKNNAQGNDYRVAVKAMIAANHAMYPIEMNLANDAIKRFNDAMDKMQDIEFLANPHTK